MNRPFAIPSGSSVQIWGYEIDFSNADYEGQNFVVDAAGKVDFSDAEYEGQNFVVYRSETISFETATFEENT